MIHSLSGGVIAENGVYTFVKVQIDGVPFWYIADIPVKEGDTVLAPFGKSQTLKRGVVQRVENCSAQCAPVPLKSAKYIDSVCPQNG